MNNYWLTELNKKSEDNNASDDADSHQSIKDKLNDRQLSLYESYESATEEFGLFDKSTKGNGAHYAPAASNPFKNEGLICCNCAFFIDGNACEIVKGNIEPEAICKLWIIPEELITIKK